MGVIPMTHDFYTGAKITPEQYTDKKSTTMKTMTCKQMGGSCDETFSAETFEEMAELSKAHGMEMFQQQDAAHLAIMAEMKSLMEKPGAMEEYMAKKRAEFDAAPDD